MKDSFYFKHDYNARNDPKLISVRRKFKGEGLAVWWVLIEILHESENHRLEQKGYMIDAIAEQSGVDPEVVKSIIDFLVNEVELLRADENGVYSERVNKNFNDRSELSDRRAIAGAKGGKAKNNFNDFANQNKAIAKQNKPSDLQKQAEEIKGEEIKGNYIKENERRDIGNNSPSFLETFLIDNEILDPETKEFITSQMWFETKAMQLGCEISEISEKAKDFLIDVRDRDLLEGKTLIDLRSHFVSWFKKKQEQIKPAKKPNYLIPEFSK